MTDTLRLIFPEWQGGYDQYSAQFMQEIPKGIEVLKGYYMGCKIMELIAPNNNNCNKAEVPMPEKETEEDLAIKNGIFAYNACVRNLGNALKILNEKKPKKILTIGGECSVSVPSFTYLANQYKDDLCIVWIDAHPDINLQGDPYPGYHAMALAVCMGMGDNGFVSQIPGKVDVKKCCVLGLRKIEDPAKITKEKIGLKSISPQENRNNPNAIIDFIKSTNCKHVCIHLDLDVLDPAQIYVAVGKEPEGMKLEEVIAATQKIQKECEVVAFTVAERMPVESMRLHYLMSNLPLFK